MRNPIISEAAPRAFIGRDREIGELRRALGETASGKGRFFLVFGEPGIGKTRLAEELSVEARRRGIEPLWGRCWEESRAAYWPWAQALRVWAAGRDEATIMSVIGGDAPQILPLVPELAPGPDRTLAPPDRDIDPEHARMRLFVSLARVLRTAAAAHPLLVVIDDLHWADLPSLRLARFLARELADAPLLLVGTCRDVEVDRTTESGQAIATLETVAEVIRLEGLAELEVGELLAAATGRAAGARLVGLVHRKSAGNPLFVRELGRLLAAQGRVETEPGATPPSIPDGVRVIVERRLARLSQAAEAVLEVAAVVGPEFSLDVVGRAAGLDSASLLPRIEEALRARLILEREHGCAFAHAIVRDVLYDRLSLSRRGAFHARVAEVLEEAPDAAARSAELAHHRLRAGDRDSALRGAEHAERAGRRALALLAYEEAAGHFERAVETLERLSPGEVARHAQLRLDLGDARWRSGDSAAAREAFSRAADDARALGDAERLAVAALGYGRLLQYEGIALGDRFLIRLLEEALERLSHGDSTLRARLLARLAHEIVYLDPVRFAPLTEEAVVMARRIGDAATLGAALEVRIGALFDSPDAARRLELANEIVRLGEASANAERTLWGRIWRVVNLLTLGDVRGADLEIEAFSRRAEELRWAWYAWFPALWKSARALLEGRFGEAEPLMLAALEIGSIRGQVAADHFGIQLLALRREQGRIAETEPLLRDAAETYPTIPAYRCALAFLYAEEGRETLARSELDRLASDDFAAIPRDYNWIVSSVLLAETCVSLGDAERAAVLHRLFLPYAGQYVWVGYAGLGCGAVSHYLGLLAATARRWNEAESHFRSAMDENARIGAAPWVARVRHDWARMLLERGDRDRGLPLLDEAAASARELGMVALRGSIEKLATRGSGSPRADAGVFRREGEFWTVRFRGEAARLKDSKGLRDIARLLAAPEREIAALDLSAEGEAPRNSYDLGEVLDTRARAEYRARLADLEAEIEEAEARNDVGRATHLRDERERLAAALAAAYGIGRRARRSGDPADRARQAVTQRIRDALSRIEKVDPALGLHLRRSLRTGTFCCYRPGQAIPWNL